MMKSNKSAFSDDDKSRTNVMADTGDPSHSRTLKFEESFQKELVSRLRKKSKCIEQFQAQVKKLLEIRNTLLSTVKAKDRKICQLNDKVLRLTQELAILKADHLQALKEMKLLKTKVHDLERKNEVFNQKKKFLNEIQTELIRSDQLLVQEKLKIRSLERIKLNPHKWRSMAYSDPHYYDDLQRKNRLQKELLKKLDLLQSKEDQLQERDALVKKLKDMLQRRPFNLIERPEEQMMQCYKTIQFQKETIKGLTAQVNMLESMISDRYARQNSVSKQKKSNEI